MHDRFEERGFTLLQDVLDERDIERGRALLARHLAGRSGTRNLLRDAACGALAAQIASEKRLAPLLVDAPRAVQCTAFAKSPERNWLVALHQDLLIPVAGDAADPALIGAVEKEGVLYVQPPADVLSRLVAVRVHLDECGAEEGPLRVVPSSHAHGILDAEAASALRERCGELACTAPLGSALVMRPLLLHASSKATSSRPRRVLHFVFGADELPFGLRWPR